MISCGTAITTGQVYTIFSLPHSRKIMRKNFITCKRNAIPRLCGQMITQYARFVFKMSIAPDHIDTRVGRIKIFVEQPIVCAYSRKIKLFIPCSTGGIISSNYFLVDGDIQDVLFYRIKKRLATIDKQKLAIRIFLRT
ncbi:hypothetical protein D3C73_755740 [compost metagenome]